MNPTIRLGNQMSRTLHKLICQTSQEEITFQHSLNLREFLLRQLKIKINVQCSDEFGDRIGVLIGFLFNDANEFTYLLLVVVCVAFA